MKLFELETVINFGKFNGEIISEVIENNENYIFWAIKNIEWFCISESAFSNLPSMKNIQMIEDDIKISKDDEYNPFDEPIKENELKLFNDLKSEILKSKELNYRKIVIFNEQEKKRLKSIEKLHLKSNQANKYKNSHPYGDSYSNEEANDIYWNLD